MKRLAAKHTFFHFDPARPPAVRIKPGEELLIEVQDAFGGEHDIARTPDPFTPGWEGHPTPLAAGPVYVEGAAPGQTLVIDMMSMTSVWPGAAPSMYTGPAMGRVSLPLGGGRCARCRTRRTRPTSIELLAGLDPHGRRARGVRGRRCASPPAAWRPALALSSLASPSSAVRPAPCPSARTSRAPRGQGRHAAVGARQQARREHAPAVAGSCPPPPRPSPTRWLATSTTPARTSFPARSRSSSSGTREPAHSPRLRASSGNVRSYCRHSPPRVAFQSTFALIP